MSAAKRGSMHIMLKGTEAGVQRNGVPSSLDVERIVHACSETGFQCILRIEQVRIVPCKKLKKNEASQKCISLVCSLFELLRFWASEDQEHSEALRTFQARWARSEKTLCFTVFLNFPRWL